jgi:hypothetical protein
VPPPARRLRDIRSVLLHSAAVPPGAGGSLGGFWPAGERGEDLGRLGLVEGDAGPHAAGFWRAEALFPTSSVSGTSVTSAGIECGPLGSRFWVIRSHLPFVLCEEIRSGASGGGISVEPVMRRLFPTVGACTLRGSRFGVPLWSRHLWRWQLRPSAGLLPRTRSCASGRRTFGLIRRSDAVLT